ncbi:MAG TPA: aromatic amino acid transport family protein [Gammaproteobacteria bacterium]|jgi:tyrosine-specific transport protein|nr:aromatic amino acid transport family protein [Gammaproteobacteria bacterium]
MDSKIIGSILLIVGTTVGAGMLALPIATAQLGFAGSIILLFVSWFVMTGGALLLLEVNLWMPANSSIVTMARGTIGPVGQFISWLTFMLLLYSVICAYISGGSGLLQYLCHTAGLELSSSESSILFTLIFGTVIYLGIRVTDYVNRGLMFVKLGSYALLVIALIPFISSDNLAYSDFSVLRTSTAVIVTAASFGFSAIVPSLRIYLQGDMLKLRKAILIGSLIPLVLYIFWDMVIMGVIPLHGQHGLASIMNASNSTRALAANLSNTASNPFVTLITKIFTSICVLTSFLGASLCLTDFLADAFAMEKIGINRIIIQAAVYLPPLIIVLFYPNAFIRALEYAGIYSIILLVLIPAYMAMRGRHKFKDAAYRVPGGSAFLIGMMMISVVAIIYSIVC